MLKSFFLELDYCLLKIDFFLIIDYRDAIMTHYKLCCEAWNAWGGRLSDRWTGGGNAWSPNGDVDRNSINVVSWAITGGSLHA